MRIIYIQNNIGNYYTYDIGTYRYTIILYALKYKISVTTAAVILLTELKIKLNQQSNKLEGNTTMS